MNVRRIRVPEAGPSSPPEKIRARRSKLEELARNAPDDAELQREVAHWLGRIEKWLSPEWWTVYLVLATDHVHVQIPA